MRDRRLEKVESKKEIVSEKLRVAFGGKTVISLVGGFLGQNLNKSDGQSKHLGAVVKQYHAIS